MRQNTLASFSPVLTRHDGLVSEYVCDSMRHLIGKLPEMSNAIDHICVFVQIWRILWTQE
jgi:hypothetical protein